jgi:hypothetical protein
LNAFTNFTSGNAVCSRSISESFGDVKNLTTPSSGGPGAIGFVVSIASLPLRFAGPASRTAASAASPFTASTTPSAQAATSANVPA